jgi:hypothetical protein
MPADAMIVVGERRLRTWLWLGEQSASVRAVGDWLVPRRVQHAVSAGPGREQIVKSRPRGPDPQRATA